MNITIIAPFDGFGNGKKPIKIKKYLESKGHTVTFINTLLISRLSQNTRHYIRRKLPYPSLIKCGMYAAEVLYTLKDKYFKNNLQFLTYYFIIIQMKLRGIVLYNEIKNLDIDLLIFENALDSFIVKYPLSCKTYYICTTPWSDELFYGGILSKPYYNKLIKLEIEIYKVCNYLSFHMYCFNQYVKKYIYNGNNLITLNAGCYAKKIRAVYSENPKIVYFGFLGGYWINLPLLAKLTKLYGSIDVYGNPPPDKKYGLNYKGYAHSDVLQKYQFGLITISKDRLRIEGSSEKLFDYISYGLPALVPDWRINIDKIKGIIPYNEKNFLAKIQEYSQKKIWEKLSNIAYKQAEDLNWNKALKPLDRILKNINKIPK